MTLVRHFPGIHVFGAGAFADLPEEPESVECAFFAYDTGQLFIAAPDLSWVEVGTGGSAALPDLSISFVDNGAAYYVAPESVTFASATEKGTGTVAYAVAESATPTDFNSETLPVTLATGDVLRVTVSDFATYKAITLVRSA